MRLIFSVIPSPLGMLHAFEDEWGFLRFFDFADRSSKRMEKLLSEHEVDFSVCLGCRSTHLARTIDSYFRGELKALSKIQIRLQGTEFQREVWAAVRRIEPGTTVSCAAICQRIGRPQAARAVGASLAGNPIAIVVPCHRVVGSDRPQASMESNLHRERWLVAHEISAGQPQLELRPGLPLGGQIGPEFTDLSRSAWG